MMISRVLTKSCLSVKTTKEDQEPKFSYDENRAQIHEETISFPFSPFKLSVPVKKKKNEFDSAKVVNSFNSFLNTSMSIFY